MSRQGGSQRGIQKVEVATPVSGATTYVARPDFGKLGTKIRLLVNGFSIRIPEKDFMRYDVVLTPEKVPKEVTRKVMECWKYQPHPELGWASKDFALAKCITYDGQKLMYSPFPIKGIEEEFAKFEIELDEAGNPVTEQSRLRLDTTRSRKFGLKIRRIKDVSMAALHQYLGRGTTQSGSKLNVEIPYEAISALEVLFRQNPILRYTTNPSGRSFYGNEGIQALPEGLEVHYGWFQSLRSMLGVPAQDGMTYKQLMLNIDVAATSFYQSGPLTDVIAQFFKKRNINDCKQSFSNRFSAHKLDSFLRNVNVEITYASSGGRKKYKIKGLAAKDAASTRIVLNNEGGNQTVSIRDYFKETYNINLQYPWLPCILAGGNDIQIPIELCMVKANQRYVKKINEAQGAEMIKVTAVRPPERHQRIMSGLDKLHGKNDENLLKDWGVHLDKNMVNVEGRILAAPPMAFGKGSQVPNDGQWAYDRGNGFVKPAVLRTWAVAVFGSPNDVRMGDIDNFLGELGKSFSAHNIKFHWADSTDKMVVYAKHENDFQGCLQAAKDLALEVGRSAPQGGPSSNKREVDFILCILKVRSTPVYNEIKRIAETEMGIVTQCCLSKFIQKPNRGYFSNIVLKINTKLGGINSSIAQPSQLPFLGENVPTMVLGADVTHPPAGMNNGVSIAALVGSVDRMFCDYRAAIRVQTGRLEIINSLEDMICELLEHFTKQNRIAPRRLLFYRDGVSEGQFGEVVYNEVTAIKNAFERMKINVPTITFLSVNKRHHIRFFATDRRNADRNGNLLAGTVVDTGCVHPYEFDFFLNSHPGLQGTSRPTHYHVLYDENKFTADSLQNLTYRLCYFYCRSTRVVSIVPAAYYSHLVAARARAHISTFEGSDTASQESGAPKNYQSMVATKVLEEVTQGMYFV